MYIHLDILLCLTTAMIRQSHEPGNPEFGFLAFEQCLIGFRRMAINVVVGVYRYLHTVFHSHPVHDLQSAVIAF
jgi:hypothetical protein